MYYIDNSGNTDPYLNLALEEYVVRNLDRRKSYVLFYINRPSLIVGKHQNIPEEINLAAADQRNIPIIRRISGGGTVYHDEGNLNFSYITRQTSKNFNQYSRFLNPIIEVLNSFGLDVEKDNRNNLLINKKKISGNAQFTSRRRLLCHGTLLFNSELEILNEVILTKNQQHIISKSSKSKRSEVTNLSDYLTFPLSIIDLKNAIADHMFKDGILEQSLTADDWSKINQLANEKYRSWDWNFGLSPKSTHTLNIGNPDKNAYLTLLVEHGRISGYTISGIKLTKKMNEKLQELLFNSRFDVENIQEIVRKSEQDKFDPEIIKTFKSVLAQQ